MDGAYRLGPTLDWHYAYVVGLPGQGGWPEWNPEWSIRRHHRQQSQRTWYDADVHAVRHGFVGRRQGCRSVDARRVHEALLGGAKLLFQRLGASDKPSVVHLEPDFWGSWV